MEHHATIIFRHHATYLRGDIFFVFLILFFKTLPVNLNILARIRVINDCLCHRGQKYWTKEALIEAIKEAHGFKISGRTLDSDILALRTSSLLGYQAPIKYSKSPKGFYYTDRDYSIDKLPLSAEDIKSLRLAASTLSQYRNIPMLSELTSSIGKVVDVVQKGNIRAGSIYEFIDFERTPLALGMEFLDQLTDAIQQQLCLSITYQKFGASPETYDIHPYLLKEYRNRWYVIAHNAQKAGIRTYALDRIKALERSDCTYDRSKAVGRDYLSGCIGMNLASGQTEEVVLQFTAAEGHYVLTQKMHRSQEVLPDSDGVTIKLDVIINFELIGIILSYGANVKVLKPQRLADKIVAISKDISEKYV